MNHLLRMMTELWHHAGPEHRVRLRNKRKGQSRTHSPHANWVAIGIQGREILAEFLASYSKINDDLSTQSQDLWHTPSRRLAEFASASPTPWRHAAVILEVHCK